MDYITTAVETSGSIVFARNIDSRREVPRTYPLWHGEQDHHHAECDYAMVLLRTFRAEWDPV